MKDIKYYLFAILTTELVIITGMVLAAIIIGG
jgi:hypothetical protein